MPCNVSKTHEPWLHGPMSIRQVMMSNIDTLCWTCSLPKKLCNTWKRRLGLSPATKPWGPGSKASWPLEQSHPSTRPDLKAWLDYEWGLIIVPLPLLPNILEPLPASYTQGTSIATYILAINMDNLYGLSDVLAFRLQVHALFSWYICITKG
jgi:hypothetical protein